MQLTSLSLALTRAGFLTGFNPLSLFSAGEPGVFFDPSDLSTLFQDSSGTTPVTAVEQPVGLMLDKSRGLVLGPELVTNGDFSDGTTGWTLGTGWDISGGVATGLPATSSLYSTASIGAVGGKSFLVSYSITSYTSGTVRSNVGATVNGVIRSSIGNYTELVNSVGGDGRVYLVVSNFVGSIDNISVRELPGAHASQTTATSRPVLSARVNQLLNTVAMTGGSWIATNTTTTANQITAPDGTLTGELVTSTSTSTYHWRAYGFFTAASTTGTFTVSLSKGTQRYLAVIVGDPNGNRYGCNVDTDNWSVVSTGTANSGVFTSATIKQNANNSSWYDVTITGRTTATSVAVYVAARDSSAWNGETLASVTGGGTWYNWGFDLRATNTGVGLPAYQRVNTATDYDAGPAFPRYLRCDGIDDGMVTSTITPGTDKAQVFAGVRKLSDAAAGILLELSPNINTNAGVFYTTAPAGVGQSTYQLASKGTVVTSATGSPYAAPITNVLTSLGDISGDLATLRIDGTQVAQSTADQGTGNFNPYPLYLFRRGGTILPFNGHFYGGIIRFGDNLPIETIEQTEVWMAAKTGVTL